MGSYFLLIGATLLVLGCIIREENQVKDALKGIGFIILFIDLVFGYLCHFTLDVFKEERSPVPIKEIILTEKDVIVRVKDTNDVFEAKKEIRSDKHEIYVKAQKKDLSVVKVISKNYYGKVINTWYEFSD